MNVPEEHIIRKLDEVVVNRIAAGEVILRPSSALKELVENSLDANAKNISVCLKDGGVKLLHITDDGCGIRVSDFPILCERFTTSKIQTFSDLSKISSFGFRGEALASVTHVAKVTIISMTGKQDCAYRAQFSDGRMIPSSSSSSSSPPQPQPCAGVRGTQIIVEDMFYNIPMRRQAMRSANDEYRKALTVMTQYALQFSGRSFTCKKHGAAKADLHTRLRASTLDNIRVLYGHDIAREVFEYQHESAKYGFKFNGYATNANYSTKQFTFVLFINNRLVGCSRMKRAIDAVYATYLPKHTHPFVYLSIHMLPQDLDVNVHPTKHEVHFLHENALISSIEEVLRSCLIDANRSRAFVVQSIPATPNSVPASAPAARSEQKYAQAVVNTRQMQLPFGGGGGGGGGLRRQQQEPQNRNHNNDGDGTAMPMQLQSPQQSYTASAAAAAAQKRKRNDATTTTTKAKRRDNATVRTNNVMPLGSLEKFFFKQHVQNSQQPRTTSSSSTSSPANANPAPKRQRQQPHVDLTMEPRSDSNEGLSSIRHMKSIVQSNCAENLRALLRNATFVGCVDNTRVLLQHNTQLYLVNITVISRHLMEQLTLYKFARMRVIKLSVPASIRELLLSPVFDGEHTETQVGTWCDTLISHAEMLREYFAIHIDNDGNVCGLPELVEHYIPPILRLPWFIKEIACDVDYTREEPCFTEICMCIGRFYSVQPKFYMNNHAAAAITPTDGDGDDDDGGGGTAPSLPWVIEHLITPTMKRKHFYPPKSCGTDGSIIQVASLENLYKVFERC